MASSSSNSEPAVSTHVEESVIISAPVATVWAAVSSLDFAWWPTVNASGGSAEGGNNPTAITPRSIHTLQFKDGTKWSLHVLCVLADR